MSRSRRHSNKRTSAKRSAPPGLGGESQEDEQRRLDLEYPRWPGFTVREQIQCLQRNIRTTQFEHLKPIYLRHIAHLERRWAAEIAGEPEPKRLPRDMPFLGNHGGSKARRGV